MTLPWAQGNCLSGAGGRGFFYNGRYSVFLGWGFFADETAVVTL